MDRRPAHPRLFAPRRNARLWLAQSNKWAWSGKPAPVCPRRRAPVPIEDYVEQTYRQAVTGITVTPDAIRASFSHLVIKDELFNAIGPAIVSGKSVFIFGPPGNGKTAMARAIGDFMNHSGGEI